MIGNGYLNLGQLWHVHEDGEGGYTIDYLADADVNRAIKQYVDLGLQKPVIAFTDGVTDTVAYEEIQPNRAYAALLYKRAGRYGVEITVELGGNPMVMSYSFAG